MQKFKMVFISFDAQFNLTQALLMCILPIDTVFVTKSWIKKNSGSRY
jgi:hypothetical protein